MKNRRTYIYNEDEILIDESNINSAEYWRKQGRNWGFKYMYKGYYTKYHEKGNQVVTYTHKRITNKEIIERKANGYKGIREYIL